MAGSARPQKKKKGWLIALIIIGIIIVAAAIIIGIQINKNRTALANLGALDSIAYQKGSLTASISGTGTVRAKQTAILSWSTSGNVGNVGVKLGDDVAKDEVLMALDESSIPVDILQAQIEVINVQQSLDALYDNAPLDLAQAKLDLITAQKSLESMEIDREIMKYQRCSDDRIEDLQEKYDDAKKLNDRFDNAQTRMQLDIAEANLNYCLKAYTDEEIAESEARVRVAEERVTSLQTKIETLKDGPDPNNVLKLETQLKIAQARLDTKDINAPFASTVTAVYNKPGDVVSPGTRAIQLADISSLYVDVQISEVDIPTIKPGQLAKLVFDAFFTQTFDGEVVEIAPIGTEVQGVVSYNVTIKMNNGTGTIKPGMTAAVSIVTENLENVFVIPIDALTSVDGVDSVYVMRNDVPVVVEVVLGAFSDDQIEVLSADIEEGEMIIINPPTSILSNMPGGFGSGMGGGGLFGGR